MTSEYSDRPEQNRETDGAFSLLDDRLSDLFDLASRVRGGDPAADAERAALPAEERAETATLLRLLDMVDASWEPIPSELDSVRALFLQKLAAREPGHPWVRSSSVRTLGDLYRVSQAELPALPQEASERLALDPTPVSDLFDSTVRSKVLGFALRTAAVPQRLMGEVVMGFNRMLTALAPLSGSGQQQNYVFTRRQRGGKRENTE